MIKDYCGSLYGNYRQYKFTDVYDNADDFVADYKDNGFPTTIKDDSANVLFYLLYLQSNRHQAYHRHNQHY